MYLYSCALLLGAEVAAAWSRPQRADGGPILTQLKRGLLGLFVRQKALPVDEANPHPTRARASGPRSVPRNH
jgi:hypothetical protein